MASQLICSRFGCLHTKIDRRSAAHRANSKRLIRRRSPQGWSTLRHHGQAGKRSPRLGVGGTVINDELANMRRLTTAVVRFLCWVPLPISSSVFYNPHSSNRLLRGDVETEISKYLATWDQIRQTFGQVFGKLSPRASLTASGRSLNSSAGMSKRPFFRIL